MQLKVERTDPSAPVWYPTKQSTLGSARSTFGITTPLRAPRHVPCSGPGVPSSPSILRAPLRYLAALRWPKLILWCYLCWYVAMVALHFDPAPRLWLSSLGISGLIGVALILSTSGSGRAPDGWTTFRLFLMPFCVSSYAALIKDQGFVLLFSPSLKENLISLTLCAGFLTAHRLARILV